MSDFWDVISSLPTIINAEATWNFTAVEICSPGASRWNWNPSLSAEQKPVDPGYAVYIYIGDEMQPSYIGISISHYKDPYHPTSMTIQYQKGLVHVVQLRFFLEIFVLETSHSSAPGNRGPRTIHWTMGSKHHSWCLGLKIQKQKGFSPAVSHLANGQPA